MGRVGLTVLAVRLRPVLVVASRPDVPVADAESGMVLLSLLRCEILDEADVGLELWGCARARSRVSVNLVGPFAMAGLRMD